MNRRVTAIVEEARKLSHEERLDLLDRLHLEFAAEHAAAGTTEEIDAAWLDECERRVALRERGGTVGIEHDQMMARLRATIRR